MNNDFKAASLPNHIDYWKSITSDQYVLNIVKGLSIELDRPYETRDLVPCHLNNEDRSHISAEINSLWHMGVIEKATHESGEVISPVFAVSKPDGSYRKILNLKHFNQYVKYEHFKMENLDNVLSLMTKDCFMTSVDLKKAYYSVMIAPSSRKYLKFFWDGQLWQYCSLPNGLSCAPRVFTRIMKTLFSVLRERGADCVFYIDDSIFVDSLYDNCKSHTAHARHVLESAGFRIHETKSVMDPTQSITFLGFILNSRTMTVSISQVKIDKLQSMVNELLCSDRVVIERLAQVIGFIISCMRAFQYGRLHYRGLELDKVNGLKRGSYKSKVILSDYAREDLRWWYSNAAKPGAPIRYDDYQFEIFTDASLQGYGVHWNGVSIGQQWSSDDMLSYGDNINCLELKAAEYALRSYKKELSGKHVLLRIDNTTAVSYINLMGGTHSTRCNEIARSVWRHAIDNNIHLSAAHIAGTDNTDADYASRNFVNPDIELCIEGHEFNHMCKQLHINPDIDLFATYANRKVDKFVSWKPDPCSVNVDAFSLDWNDFTSIYIFPPFSLLGRVLAKLRTYRGAALIVYPNWKGQFWYPSLQRLVTQHYDGPITCQNARIRLRAGRIK